MANLYELLGVAPTASADEIKRAFRQEIARYHPDKVQHLGKEFQELATTRAADLTHAYQVLMDPKQRAEYDERLQGGGVVTTVEPPPPPPASRVHPSAPPPEPVVEPPPRPEPSGLRDEFMRKAAVGKFRQAVQTTLGTYETLSVKGFEVAFASRRGGLGLGFFKKPLPPTRILGRFVSRVDSASIEETWPLALKSGAPNPDLSVCAFVLGSGLAPARELATAISEQRKRQSRGGSRVVVIPVDVRDWEALVPTDAPPTVKAILDSLKADS